MCGLSSYDHRHAVITCRSVYEDNLVVKVAKDKGSPVDLDEEFCYLHRPQLEAHRPY